MGCLAVIYYAVVLIIAAIPLVMGGAGTFIGIVIIGGAIALHIAVATAEEPAEQAEGGRAHGRYEASSRDRAQHFPPAPSVAPQAPWLPGRVPVEVVGETYRQDSFREIFRGRPWAGEGGDMKTGPATLTLDSGNPYDANAVAVWFEGHHVGYLPADTAASYAPHIREALSGNPLEAEARVWARRDTRVRARVTVKLPEPHSIKPINSLPDEPHVVLPPGSRIQVTKEDEHMDILREVVVSGVDAPVAVTLHGIHEIRPRSAVEAVEVRIHGERVGVLSPAQSANMLPLVKYVEERGKVPVSRAWVTGSVLKADVVLNCIRADEVTPEWLEGLGPAAPRTVEARTADEWDDRT